MHGPLHSFHGFGYVLPVHWFRRPPYARWAAGIAVVVVALVVEAFPGPTALHPFLRHDVAAGREVGAADLEWIETRAGLLPAPDVTEGAMAVTDLMAGEPLLPSDLGGAPRLPPDWWAVAVPLDPAAVPGDPARLVIADPFLVVDGIVTAPAGNDPYGYRTDGLVAVPGDVAPAVAAAAAYDGVITLLHP